MTNLFRGIGWRIFFSFSMLLVGLTLTLSFVALKFVQKTATDNAANELRVLSVTLSEQLQRLFKRIENGAKSLSGSGGVIDTELKKEIPNKIRLNNFLELKLSTLSPFESLAVFDTSGTCIASTNDDWRDVPAQRESFFINGLKHFNFSDIYVRAETTEKVLLISTPVNEGADPHGVLVGRVRLQTIYDLMGQQLGVGPNSEAFLLDARLRFVTPGKSAPDELRQSHLAQTPLVQHLQEEFWVGRYRNYRSVEVLGTVMKPLSNGRWYLVIERDFAEVQNQLAQVRQALFTATSILLFALILVTVLLSASITKPLQGLVEGTQRIASGDLSQPFDVPSGSDEITFLAREFDKMRARVADSQGRLIEQLEESEQRRIENERLAAIGTLASSLAHEIRNPLNAMSLLLSQLERSKAGDETRAKSITEMREEIGRLDRLVSDILDYARPLQLQREKFDLRDFISSITAFYKPVFEEKGVQLKLETPPREIRVEADRDRLRQAFVNLIQNAIDAMGEGGRLTIKVEIVNGSVQCTVQDTGVGIAPAAISRLFDLFFTTKERGTGLGLSMVRKIVDAHGGRIHIESVPKKGASVIINLPAALS